MVTSKHPKGLYLIFATGMAERFSYYGMRAIFSLFLIKALLMDKALASSIYGDYTGLVYLTPLLGGYVADRYWGIRRSVFWGGMMMLVGQLLMFCSASTLDSPDTARLIMYFGLAFIIFGNGFFKPTITTLVGDLYLPNDSRKDTAFTIFYMGVNVGAFAAPLICGFLGETNNPEDFKWGFLAASIAMLMSLCLFEWLKDKYIVSPTGEQIGIVPPHRENKVVNHNPQSLSQQLKELSIWSVGGVALFALFYQLFDSDLVSAGIFSSCLIFPAYILTDKTLTKIERKRILVIYIIAFFVIFFWSAFEQAGASLTFFADEQTDRTIFGWTMPSSYFQSFNPIFVVLFAPLLAMLWTALGKRGQEPNSPMKQACGLFLLAVGYLIIALGVRGSDSGVKVSMLWLTSLYFVHTLGELCLSPIGLAMVNKLAPARLGSLLMGIWYLSSATSNKFAGILSALYPEKGEVKFFLGYEIANLYDFFMLFVIMAGVSSIILFGLSNKLQKMMEE